MSTTENEAVATTEQKDLQRNPIVAQSDIVQLMFDDQISILAKEFSEQSVIAFLDNALHKKDFGQTGNYSMFCKKCGGAWFFESKEEKRIFDRIHDITGCLYKWKLNGKKDRKNYVQARIPGLIPYAFEQHAEQFLISKV